MKKDIERSQKYANLIKLGLHPDEVEEVLADDEKIDKGEKLFELTDDQKKAEKKYKNTHTRTVKTAYGQTLQKEKKVDAEKRMLIDAIVEKLENYSDSGTVTVLNPEREIELMFHNRKFKVVLSAPRT